jgi:predicted Zn-dependent protease
MELRANQPAAAAEVLNHMIASAKDGEAANAAGMMLTDESRFDEARTRFRQAVDREPGVARYWFNLGQTQLVLADPAAASESFTRAASLEPGSLPVVLAAVRTALGQHNVASARKSVDALLKEVPDDPVTQLLLGDVAMSEGKAQQAEVAYARSFGLRPSSLAAIGEYQARVRLEAPRAVEPLQGWLSREPEDSAARHLLADYYLGRGEDDAARVQLETLVRQTPNDVVALNNLAWLLRDADKARAEQLAVQANAIAPDNPAVADTLGTILLANDKAAEALPALKKAANALPDDKSVQGHYAEALRRVEDSR